MSKLTETVCIKVSKDTKQFLDGMENSSMFIRELINRSKSLNEDLEGVTSFKAIDGEEYISYDEDKLHRIIDSFTERVIREVFTHSLRQSDGST